MIKHLFFSIIVFIVLHAFSSCQQIQKKKVVIGVSQCSDDLWRQTMDDQMQREVSLLQDINLELIIKLVKDDTKQQVKDIEEFISQGVDLLVISPNESKAITEVVQKAYRQGIPVVLVDRKIDTEEYTAYVGADNYEIGKEAAAYTSMILNASGNVVVMRGLYGSTSDNERYRGFSDELKNYPGIKIITKKRGNFLMDEAEKQMAEILQNQEKIDLVFALNDPMALGVYKALTRYKGKLPFIMGIDALPGKDGGIENIQKGLIDASFIYPTGGDKVIEVAVNILEGKEYKKENILKTAVVDKNNVKTILLQTDQIAEQQTKLETTRMLLNQSIIKYSNQRILFYSTIIVLVIITALLVFLILAYRSKSRINAILEKQNEEIRQQKEQLVLLSQQLEEATHAKLVFFTNISHEFRTPLSLILGPLDTLLTSFSLTDKQQELLRLIQRNSNRLLSLVSQIIEFRSFENGKMNLCLTNGDLVSFLKDLNVVFVDHANRMKINFDFYSEIEILPIQFDQEKIEKIYSNLLSNAFKYTPARGNIKVSLTTDRENKEFILSVLNSGTVIPIDKIKNIFDRFYKINLSDTGTGIGLALTSSLVEVHNGKIFVESTNEKGTIFTIHIPIITIDDIYEASEQIEPHLSDFNLTHKELSDKENKINEVQEIYSQTIDNNKPIVLVIEDNYDMQQYIKLSLQKKYNLIHAYDGDSGIEKAIRHIPDAIICDVMLPQKDGFEVCSTLKKNTVTSHIPIIILTACSQDEHIATGLESGADGYITKPFNVELLDIRLKKIIESRQKLKETFGNNLINTSKNISLTGTGQKLLDDFQAYVEKYIDNSVINVDSIATHLGLSRIQLYRKLQSVTNYSPNELINVIKLKYAVQLLTVERKTISETAYETGFSSPSYFSKIFKKYYNENPTDFLKRVLVP